jgi:malonyl CoA-acyl carrier protein transacylase
MAAKKVKVNLAEYVAEMEPTALKELAPAPIARRVEDMLDLLHAKAKRLKEVGPSELVCALIHTTDKTNVADLAKRVETYREAQVWQTLETTKRTGQHTVTLSGPGRRRRGN